MHLFPDSRGDCYMGEHSRHGPHFLRRDKPILVLRNVLRNLNRVFPNRAKRLRQFFAAVDAHGITSLWDCPPTPADPDFDALPLGYVTISTQIFHCEKLERTS